MPDKTLSISISEKDYERLRKAAFRVRVSMRKWAGECVKQCLEIGLSLEPKKKEK